MSLAARALVGLVRAYQVLASPLLPAACRYYPTCSRFAAEAIVRFGAARGAALAARRICRCHPWGGHGYDPVPENPKLENRNSKIVPEERHAHGTGFRFSGFAFRPFWRRKVAAREPEAGR